MSDHYLAKILVELQLLRNELRGWRPPELQPPELKPPEPPQPPQPPKPPTRSPRK